MCHEIVEKKTALCGNRKSCRSASAEEWNAATELLRGYLRVRAELVRLMDVLGFVASAN
jgi:hypothetical protein